MSRRTEPKDKIVEFGGIEMLVMAVTKYPSDDKITMFAISALRNVACNDANEARMVSCGVITICSNVLHHHHDNVDVMRKTCCLLRNISRSNDACESIIEMSEILTSILHLCDDVDVATHVIAVLCNVATETILRKNKIFDSGAMVHIISNMKHWPCNSDLSSVAMCALFNLSDCDGFSDAMKANDHDGINAIIMAAKNQIENADSCIQAFWMLYTVLRTGGGDDIQSHFIDMIKTVTQAMTRHVNQSRLQRMCCLLSRYLALHSDNRSKMIDVIDLIVIAMTKFSDDVNLQDEACRALHSIAVHNDDVRNRIVQCGGVDLVLSVIRKYPLNVDVLSHAYGALLKLTFGSQINKMVSIGVLELISDAMTRHPKHAVLVGYINNLIVKLSVDKANVTRILLCHGIDYVLRSLVNFPDDCFVQMCGCAALYSLLRHNDENRAYAVQHGAVELIINNMKKNVDDAQIQRISCVILGELSADLDIKKRIIANGGIDLVTAAVHFKSKDVELLDAASETYWILSNNAGVSSRQSVYVYDDDDELPGFDDLKLADLMDVDNCTVDDVVQTVDKKFRSD